MLTFLNNHTIFHKSAHLLLVLFFSVTLNASTSLIVLGSGTPNPDPDRYGSAYAVVVNDRAYLVDFGPGVVRRISAMSPSWGGDFPQLELQNINHAFLTHIHSDHSGGLSDLILTPWVMGRDSELSLYGPKGLKDMAQNITNAYSLDIDYRLNGTQPANSKGFISIVKEIDVGSIYKDKNIEVVAFRNSHGDLYESYGYLFITEDKKILFSGDTAISSSLKNHAKDLDILVHEVYSSEGFKSKTDDWKIYHQAHHTSSIDLGILANELKPAKLVASHILFWGASEESVIKDIELNFKGKVILATDLLVID